MSKPNPKFAPAHNSPPRRAYATLLTIAAAEPCKQRRPGRFARRRGVSCESSTLLAKPLSPSDSYPLNCTAISYRPFDTGRDRTTSHRCVTCPRPPEPAVKTFTPA